MTLPATTRRAGPFSGNGVTTAFPFTFKVFAASDISVIKTSTAGVDSVLVLNSAYSVALNVDQDATPGGTITYPITGTPLAGGEKLSAVGALPFDQTLDLPSGGNFSPVALENALDRVEMQLQQTVEQANRAITLPASSSGNGVLPDVSTRANKLLSFDSAGNVAVTLSTTTDVTVFAANLANAVDPAKGSALVGHVPVGTLSSSTVQGALNEIVSDLAAASGSALVGHIPSGTLSSSTVQGALNEIVSDLAATSGSALVGYNPLQAYLANSVGAELIQAQGQVDHLWGKIRANQSDIFAMVTGDSTGNGTDEWVYLMAQWLASKCPTHTVKYRLYGLGDGSVDAWGAYATLQTGTGPTSPDATTNTIWVDNASVSGTNTFYAMGGRETLIWGGNDYDLVIVNYGHNIGTDTTEEVSLPEWIVAAAQCRLLAPRAGLLLTLQNPRTSTAGAAQSSRQVNAWRKTADLVGAGVIDVYTAFKTNANPSSLYADETHPNAAGQAVWLAEVQRVMAEPRRLTGLMPGGISPLSISRTNYAPNPRFSTWSNSASSVPDGWAFTNCTPTKSVSVTDGTLYSAQVAIGAGASPTITADLSLAITHLKGKTICMMVRIWRPTGLGLLAGRIDLTSTDNVSSSSSFASYPRGTPSTGGWEWVMSILTIPLIHTKLTATIYAGAADGSDSGKKFYVDCVGIFDGVLPGSVSLDLSSSKSIGDYYGDANVGLVSGNTGTVTAVSATVTLAGAPSGHADVYINLPGLTAGVQYKFSFSAGTCTGNVGGGIYVRAGYNGGSSTITSGAWTASTPGSVTFTAPAGPVSLWVYGYTGATGFVFSLCSITALLAGNTSQFPQNSQSSAYTLIGTDAGKHLLHPSSDTTARTWTIPANTSVDYPIGTAVTFVNQASGGVITISVTTDTMRLAGAGATGNRTLAANGIATALKVTSTEWIISGTGLT